MIKVVSLYLRGY